MEGGKGQEPKVRESWGEPQHLRAQLAGGSPLLSLDDVRVSRVCVCVVTDAPGDFRSRW